MNRPTPTLFNRLLLPGFAFKAVVIGGGYATGRELAEFFLPSGPRGGLAGMLLAMTLWSLICTLTFLFARMTCSANYRAFFVALLGRAWIVFDAAYLCLVFVTLAVFAAAAGAVGAALFGWPLLAGTMGLIGGIAAVAAFGSASVERLFKYVTYFLYAVYAVFVVLSITKFSGRIAARFWAPAFSEDWVIGGITYASYNVVGAVAILPVLRHMTSYRDALVAGLLCGPLAMIPAIVFFVAMIGYYPEIVAQTLPSDYLLVRLNVPILHFTYQIMILLALLESGTGLVHAVNERVASAYGASGRILSQRARFALSVALLVFSVFVAQRFGLVTLIARGYRLLGNAFLIVFVLPLFTCGVYRLWGCYVRWRISEPQARGVPGE
jgi:uncharacterized membrane protein YkvI